MTTWVRATTSTLVLFACASACTSSSRPWQIVGQNLMSGETSMWGASSSDVFVVGGDLRNGHGPSVQHFDGTTWTQLAPQTGLTAGNLWWVFGFADGPVYMGGDGATILSYQNGAFTQMTTPGPANVTVFGIWGASPDDVWAVGGTYNGNNGAFAWRLQNGGPWTAAAGFPADLNSSYSMWKMSGRSTTDAWMVGTNGLAVQWNGTTLTAVDTGAGESLYTVSADSERYVAVGGGGGPIILENDGSGTTWTSNSPEGGTWPLIGVNLSPHGDYTVGLTSTAYQRGSSKWEPVSLGKDIDAIDDDYHSVWVDPSGGVWITGGSQVLNLPLLDGIVLHDGASVPGGLQ